MTDYLARVDRLRESLCEQGLGGLLVFGPKNVRYLTGFGGSAGVVLVDPERLLLLSDFRYRLRALEEAPVAEFVELEGQLAEALPALLSDLQGTLGIEADHLTLEQWGRLELGLGETPTRETTGLVERLRMVKEPKELVAMRRAAELAAAVLARLAGERVVGRSERDVALDLEMWLRGHGSGAVPFDFIVAGGAHGAMPHAESSEAPIEPGGLLVVDLGATVDGYASDITRTFATGALDAERQRIFEVVLEAQRAAREAARPGITCRELDAVARDLIKEAGYGELFGHGLGHGVGLEVHEAPRVGWTSEEVLRAGMVITIEPGIYIPEVGGVRIEDTVLVTDTGIEVLTEVERELVTLS